VWELYRIHDVHSRGKLETGTSENKEEVDKKERRWFIEINYNLKIKCVISYKLMAFLASGSLVQWFVDGNIKSYIVRSSDSVQSRLNILVRRRHRSFALGQKVPLATLLLKLVNDWTQSPADIFVTTLISPLYHWLHDQKWFLCLDQVLNQPLLRKN